MTDVVFEADLIVPVTTEPLIGGWIAVTDGVIESCGTGDPPPSKQKIKHSGCAILPGLVNAHSHLGCSFLAGETGDLGFLDWLSGAVTPQVMAAYMGPKARAMRPQLRDSALRAARGLLATGTTTIVDSFFDSIGFEVLQELGLRGLFCREYFGSRDEDLQAYAAMMRSRTRTDEPRFRSPKLNFGLAPHALYTCPRDVLVEVFGEAQDHQLALTIHVAESEAEYQFFKNAHGPMKNLFAPGERLERYNFGMSPVEMMHSLGLLRPGVALVHMVHVDEHDLDLVAESGAGIVHCPGSNAQLQVGAAPLRKMLSRNIPVAIGTDSLASNHTLNVFHELRLASSHFSPLPIDYEALIKMATIDAANVFGLGEQVGSLDAGKLADLSVFQLPANWQDHEDGKLAWFLSADQSIEAVYSESKLIHGVNDAK